LAFAFMCVIVTVRGEVDEKDVIVLDDANFDATLAKFEYMLVEFYAPWCGHCKELTPNWARAATRLKKEVKEVGVAKVDGDANQELGRRFGVQGFPTIKWFVKGEHSDFEGGRSDSDIVAWVKKRMSPPCKILNTTKHFDDYKGSEEVVMLAFLDAAEGDVWSMFEGVAKRMDDVTFAVTHEKDIFAAAKYQHGDVVMFKKHTQAGGIEEVIFGKSASALESQRMNALEDWVKIERLPIVTEFSQMTTEKIFTSPVKSQALFFANHASEGVQEARIAFEKVAKEFRGKIVSVFVEAKKNLKVIDYFGVSEKDTPCIYLATAAEGEGQMKKFKGPTTEELRADAEGVIGTLFEAHVKGLLKPHRKSEGVPLHSKDEHGVVTLVGSTFDGVVADATKDVLVEFYAPWCGHCKQLAPIYDKLASEMQSVSSVVIAKMDATANDVPEDLQMGGFPSIKFWKAGSDRSPKDFEGDRTVKGFRKFLKANAGIKFELPPKKKKKATAEL